MRQGLKQWFRGKARVEVINSGYGSINFGKVQRNSQMVVVQVTAPGSCHQWENLKPANTSHFGATSTVK